MSKPVLIHIQPVPIFGLFLKVSRPNVIIVSRQLPYTSCNSCNFNCNLAATVHPDVRESNDKKNSDNV